MRKILIVYDIKSYRKLLAEKQIDLDFTTNQRLRDSLEEEIDEVMQCLKKHEDSYIALMTEDLKRLYYKEKRLDARIEAQGYYDLDLEEQLRCTRFRIMEAEKEIDRLGLYLNT